MHPSLYTYSFADLWNGRAVTCGGLLWSSFVSSSSSTRLEDVFFLLFLFLDLPRCVFEARGPGLLRGWFIVLQVALGFLLLYVYLYGIMIVSVDDMMRDPGCGIPEPFISVQGSAPFPGAET